LNRGELLGIIPSDETLKEILYGRLKYPSWCLIISQALEEKKFVELSVSPQGVSSVVSRVMGAEEFHRQASALCGYTNGILAQKTLRSLPLAEREEIRDLVDVAYKASGVFAKVHGKEHPLLANDLNYQTLSAKLGGRVLPCRLKEDESFVRFIKANHLHHKIQSLGHQVPSFRGVYVDGLSAPIPWTEFKQEPDNGEISFKAYGKEWFRTLKNGVLTSDYCYLDGKIARYNPMTSTELRRYDTEPASGDTGWSCGLHYMMTRLACLPFGVITICLFLSTVTEIDSAQASLVTPESLIFQTIYLPLAKKRGF
jgi:hypothetical protein